MSVFRFPGQTGRVSWMAFVDCFRGCAHAVPLTTDRSVEPMQEIEVPEYSDICQRLLAESWTNFTMIYFNFTSHS